MSKKLLLYFCFITLAVHSSQEVAPKNLFDLIPNDCIKVIADNLDENSRRSLRACDRRLCVAEWPSERVLHITLYKGCWQLEEAQFWEKVLRRLRLLSQGIERAQANNDIILRVTSGDTVEMLLPDELTHFKNLAGLFMGYHLSGNDFYRQEQEVHLEKLLAMMPNLKHLSLPWDYQKPLAPMLNQLKKLQTLWVNGSKLEAADFASMPSTIKELQMCGCKIWGIPSMGKFKSLRSLSLSEYFNGHFQTNKSIEDLEKLLSPLAPFLEKLKLVCFGFRDLPLCLASFQNLKELNISHNRLNPASLSCLTKLPKLRLINLVGNEQCESQKDLVRSMFPPCVTISYEYRDSGVFGE